MQLFYLFLIIILLSGCRHEDVPSFEFVDCDASKSIEMPNLRKIFKPCRQYIYRAKYWHSDDQLISDEYIAMMATGNPWSMQPAVQDELIIQYNHNKTDIERAKEFNINEGLTDRQWEWRVVTGIIETEGETWMHPFRSNQYIFTEVAAFPSVKFPLEEGSTWSTNLSIYQGWGDWENSFLENDYEAMKQETIHTPFRKMSAWHVTSTTTTNFGASQHDFWYNEEYGFVKMIIKNYKDQLLQFELVEVKEGS